MKYAVNYLNRLKLENFDEIIIDYDKQDRELPTFLQEYSNKTIILSIKQINFEDFYNDKEWIKLNAIYEKNNNFIVRFSELGSFQEFNYFLQESIGELKMPYFVGFVVTNYDQLQYMFSQRVCAVYLAEEICFDLTCANGLCKQHKVQVRVFPNVAQSSIKAAPALKKFFLRPEDVELYSDVIDVLEFWGPLDRQEILAKIYKKGIWNNDLSALILDLDLPIDGRRMPPWFGAIRKDCRRECARTGGCNKCFNLLAVGKKMREHNTFFIQKKKR